MICSPSLCDLPCVTSLKSPYNLKKDIAQSGIGYQILKKMFLIGGKEKYSRMNHLKFRIPFLEASMCNLKKLLK